MRVHGAEVCVRGGTVEVLEGDWQPAHRDPEVPDLAAARRSTSSREYAKARHRAKAPR